MDIQNKWRYTMQRTYQLKIGHCQQGLGDAHNIVHTETFTAQSLDGAKRRATNKLKNLPEMRPYLAFKNTGKQKTWGMWSTPKQNKQGLYWTSKRSVSSYGSTKKIGFVQLVWDESQLAMFE